MTYTEPLTVSPAMYATLSVRTAKETCALLLVFPIACCRGEGKEAGLVVDTRGQSGWGGWRAWGGLVSTALCENRIGISKEEEENERVVMVVVVGVEQA